MNRDDIVKAIKKMARLHRLDRWNKIGTPKAKNWGGKKTTKEARREIKRNLKKEY